MTALRYLDFDYSEDAQGCGTFDAMATVAPDQAPHVIAEISLLLAWAKATFPEDDRPLDEGGTWDHALQQTQDTPALVTISFWLTGSADFCNALRVQFDIDD